MVFLNIYVEKSLMITVAPLVKRHWEFQLTYLDILYIIYTVYNIRQRRYFKVALESLFPTSVVITLTLSWKFIYDW